MGHKHLRSNLFKFKVSLPLYLKVEKYVNMGFKPPEFFSNIDEVHSWIMEWDRVRYNSFLGENI